MHADEANQAVKLGALLEGKGYRFDPSDHHGPTLYYFAQSVAWAAGERSLAELTERTVRLTPAIFGSLSLMFLWLLLRRDSEAAALIAVALLAAAPPAVYYSRYFIQETLLVAFTLLTWWGGAGWWRHGRASWAMITGLGMGLMLATKASAVFFLALSVAAFWSAGCLRLGQVRKIGYGRVLLAGATAALVAAAFYSSWGIHVSGIGDALRSLGGMSGKAVAGTTGHEKPWWYYASLFWFQRTGGLWWHEVIILGLALMGIGWGLRRGSALVRFLAWYVIGAALVLSVIPYKTPWIVINFLPGMCALTGLLLGRKPSLLAAGVTLAALAEFADQTTLAVFRRPADARNPFAYQHAAADVLKVPALVAGLPAGPIKVISREYWPLPWYLRHRPEVGYWTEPPADCAAVCLFVDASQADAVRARLSGDYQESILGLRPGFLLVVFTRRATAD